MASTLQPIFDQKMFQTAREIIKKQFAADPNPGSIRHVYLANIAMLLYDHYAFDHATANAAADDIIKLAFEDTYY